MGQLAGIARHSALRGPVEELSHVSVTRASGVTGNCRGKPVNGKVPRRQVSLMEAESWAKAMAQLGLEGEQVLPWSARRANLLVEGITLPREPGAILAIGSALRIEITMECDPCSRMEEIQPGLMAALEQDWRGGVLGMVLDGGDIAIGDEVRIEG